MIVVSKHDLDDLVAIDRSPGQRLCAAVCTQLCAHNDHHVTMSCRVPPMTATILAWSELLSRHKVKIVVFPPSSVHPHPAQRSRCFKQGCNMYFKKTDFHTDLLTIHPSYVEDGCTVMRGTIIAWFGCIKLF